MLILGAAWPGEATQGGSKPGGARGSSLRDLTLEELGAIEVTSVSKLPMEVWSTPVAVAVITSDDIRRSGATSLPDVLRLAPGVEVARVDSSHWSIGVRGFGDQFSKSLLVLVDGRNLYTPLFAGTYWPVYDVPLDDVERIEIIRGPGGTVWGGNAVNGVINVVTRSAADTRGTMVAVGGGSVDHGMASLRHGGGRGGFDYRVQARAFTRGPQFHSSGADFDGDQWMGQAGFRTDWAARDRGQFTFSGTVITGQHGQRVQIARLQPPSQIIVDDPVDSGGGHLLAAWERRIGAGTMRLQSYYDRTSWRAPHFEEVRDTIDVDYVQTAPLTDRHRLSWGAGARWSPGRFTQTTVAIDFDPRDRTDRLYSAYAEDEIRLIDDRFALTVGSKFEHNVYTGLELQPSARVLWRPGPTSTAWGAVTRAVRTPSRVERAIRATSLTNLPAPVPVFLRVEGNDQFDAERLIGYEVGYRTLVRPSLYVDTAIFHNEHDGLASFGLSTPTLETSPPPTRAVIRFPYVNGVAGSSSGLEVASDWRPASALRAGGSYAFRTFDLRQLPVSVDPNAVTRYEGSSPRHVGHVQLGVSLPHGLEIDGAYRYVSALPARGVSGYHSADARLGFRLSRTLDLSIAGRNLLQRHHVEFSHAPGPFVGIARSVWVGLRWERVTTP